LAFVEVGSRIIVGNSLIFWIKRKEILFKR